MTTVSTTMAAVLEHEPSSPRASPVAGAAIEFRHVSISFGEKSVLRDISFTLPHGETIIITGASGSGKSVLLHLAIGLLRPDSGQIFIGGREIDTLDEDELLSIRGGEMGLVFQDETLFTGLSVYDNAAYRLVEHGSSEEATRIAVGEVLRFVGLEEDADKLPEELSGGMRRRLEFARALIGYPPIMLYDEPTLGLDPLTATQILDLILRARDLHGISSLLVTKRLDQILYLVTYRAAKDEDGKIVISEVRELESNRTRVMLLDGGRITFLGSYAEFAACPVPAVERLLHPESSGHIGVSYSPDPWGKSRSWQGSSDRKRKKQKSASSLGGSNFLFRALAVWLIIICAESAHSVLRTIFLVPYVGDFQARQIGVGTGSLLILLIAFLFVRWLRADTTRSLVVVGVVWLALTILFEVSLGRLILGLSWERLASDYDLSRGGLLPLGLLLMTISPLVAARLRGLKIGDKQFG